MVKRFGKHADSEEVLEGSRPDFLLKTPSMEAGIEVKKSWEDSSKYYKMSAMILKSFQTLQKKIDDELEQYQFLVLEHEKGEGE